MTQEIASEAPAFGRAGGSAGARLRFLDLLRGVAALAVAVGHRAESTFPGFSQLDENYFRLGQFGVVVFFLSSGFIIPASLERGTEEFVTS